MPPKTPSKAPATLAKHACLAPQLSDSSDTEPKNETPVHQVDPGEGTSSQTMAQEDEEEPIMTVWDFFDKDPKFKKDKDKKQQYPDGICRKCKIPVPRSQATTKGMNQHLENHHPKLWKKVLEGKLKASKAKV